MRKNIFTSALLLSVVATAPAWAGGYALGDRVDNFELLDVDGVSHSLYDYAGKIIVLNFGEYWCDPCNQEWSEMGDEIWEPYKDEGVVIFTIGSDDLEQQRQKRDQYNAEWVWLFDPDGSLFNEYGISFIPWNYLLDQDFHVIYKDTLFRSGLHRLHEPIQEHQYDVFVHQILPRTLNTTPGGSIDFGVTLTNATGGARAFQAWVDAIVPGHIAYPENPVMAQPLTLPGGMTAGDNLELAFPDTAPTGDYWIRVGVGDEPGTPLCSDLFRVVVE